MATNAKRRNPLLVESPDEKIVGSKVRALSARRQARLTWECTSLTAVRCFAAGSALQEPGSPTTLVRVPRRT
jgi:hypothetical protein